MQSSWAPWQVRVAKSLRGMVIAPTPPPWGSFHYFPITNLGSRTRAGAGGISWASPLSVSSRTGEWFLGAVGEEDRWVSSSTAAAHAHGWPQGQAAGAHRGCAEVRRAFKCGDSLMILYKTEKELSFLSWAYRLEGGHISRHGVLPRVGDVHEIQTKS